MSSANDRPPASGAAKWPWRWLDGLRPSRIEGFVDSVRAGEVLGWALDASRPERRVHVMARAMGEVIAESLADLPRRDLIDLGKGDGRYGFRLRIPGGLSEEARLAVVIEAVAKPRNVALKRGRVSLPPTVKEAETPAPAPARCGFLERFSGREVSGWGVDPQHPDRPAKVDLFDGERFLGIALCDVERPGLVSGGAPAGAKGFVFRLPQGVEIGDGAALRGRITGSRLELARSKNYPGAGAQDRHGDAHPVDPPDIDHPGSTPAPEARPAAAPPAVAVPVLRRPVEGVSILICGEADGDAIDRTLESVRAQTWPHVETLRVGPGDDIDVEALALRQMVILLRPGEHIDADFVSTLMSAATIADVWTWAIDSERPVSSFPRLRALIGQLDGRIALRGAVFAEVLAAPEVLRALLQGSLREVERTVAERSLRWRGLDGALARRDAPDRPSERSGHHAPSAPPRRVSIALWGPWIDDASPALAALQSGLDRCEVEAVVLADQLPEEMLRRLTTANSIVSVRLVDTPRARGDGAAWRALTEAATGQVVILCRNDVVLRDPEALEAMCAWALAPEVGAVTVSLAEEGSPTLMAGLSLVSGHGAAPSKAALAPAAGVEIVPAASAAFMIASKAALTAVGGFDAIRLPEDVADLDLGLRLARDGRATLSFTQTEADAGAPLHGTRPLTPSEVARLGTGPQGAVIGAT